MSDRPLTVLEYIEALQDRCKWLEAEHARLRAALNEVVARSENGELGSSKVIDMRRIAQAALNGEAGE